jgi:hypothetical protein
MSRIWIKSKGLMPKKLFIQQSVDKKAVVLFGPYFSKQSLGFGMQNVEFELCETTGNYIRITPL